MKETDQLEALRQRSARYVAVSWTANGSFVYALAGDCLCAAAHAANAARYPRHTPVYDVSDPEDTDAPTVFYTGSDQHREILDGTRQCPDHPLEKRRRNRKTPRPDA
jgi:hypothetical protein